MKTHCGPDVASPDLLFKDGLLSGKLNTSGDSEKTLKGVLAYIKKNCKDLTKLNISSNNLTELPKDFAESLPNLTHLFVSNNELTQLPVLQENLTTLLAFNNKLEEIMNLPEGLKHLIVYNNKLEKIMNLPEGLISLSVYDNPNLTTLDISNLTISSLDLWEVGNLKILKLPPNLKEIRQGTESLPDVIKEKLDDYGFTKTAKHWKR